MTTYKGTNFTIVEAPTPSTVLATELWGGRVKAVTDKWQGAVDSGSILKMGRMPKGALPLGGFLRYSGDATTTLSIGYTGATQYLGSATALATTKTQVFYPSKDQWNTPLTASVDIYVSVNTKPLAASDTLMMTFLYAKD